MAEVINLLSSSPLQQSPCRRLSISGARRRHSGNDRDSAELNTPGDIDFGSAQSTKRRRISPRLASQGSKTYSASFIDAVFELSSEPEPDYNFPPKRNACNLEWSHYSLGASDDDLQQPPFSSSAPENLVDRAGAGKEIVDLVSDDAVFDDPIVTSSQPQTSSRPVFSALTLNVLAELGRKPTKSKFENPRSRAAPTSSMKSFAKESKPKRQARKEVKVDDKIIDSSQSLPSPKIVNQPKVSAASKKIKDAEREARNEIKRFEKEQKRQEKQKAADIAEVNKSKTNKKVASPEMMVEMSRSLKDRSLGNQVEELMKQIDVQTTYIGEEDEMISNSKDDTVIRWRRKVVAEYDEDLERWNPLPKPRITQENHILVYLTAEDFCSVAADSVSDSSADEPALREAKMKSNLDTHVAELRSRYPHCTIIYLIQGLTAWLRKGQNAKNRAYVAAVRSQVSETAENTHTTASSEPRASKKRKAASTPAVDLSRIDNETAENLLLHLQLNHQPLVIHQTTSINTSAAQICTFTQHLATRPYRLAQQSQNLASSSFCMDTGQIRTAADPAETFICMLQEIQRVTPSMAHGIAAAGYGSVGKLVQGFRADGNLMLEDVRKAMNKDGGWSDRRLGPMVSKRLYKVFMGRDPAATDGIA